VTLSCLIVYHLIIIFEQWCLDNLAGSENNSIGSILDIMFIRKRYSVLPVHFELSASQITKFGLCTSCTNKDNNNKKKI